MGCRPTLRPTAGFTLLELIFSVMILGTLITVLSHFIDPTPAARAQAMYSLSERMANSWMLIAANCGTSTDTVNSPLFTSGQSAESVLAEGSTAVNQTYLPCYEAANVQPISDLAYNASAGSFLYDSLAISLVGGGSSPVMTTFNEVAPEIATIMALQFAAKPPALPLPAMDTTDARVRWQQLASGNYQINILFPVTSTTQASASLSPWSPSATPAVATNPAVVPAAITLVALGGAQGAPVTSPVTIPVLSAPAPTTAATTPPSSSSSSPPPPPPPSGGSSPPPATATSYTPQGNYPTITGLPASPQDLSMPCSNGWNGPGKIIDNGQGNVTIYYAGYNETAMSPFTFTPNFSNVSATGGPISAAVQGTASSASASVEYCVAQNTYTWNAAQNAWNDTSWAYTYGSFGGTAGATYCSSANTNTSNGATANISNC